MLDGTEDEYVYKDFIFERRMPDAKFLQDIDDMSTGEITMEEFAKKETEFKQRITQIINKESK